MCGIFGAIGKGYNKHIIRSLALANRARGTDAVGFVGSDGNIFKGAGDPMKYLCSTNYDKYEESQKESWFMLGHTRAATGGSKNEDENAHPFQYGKWIGIHNGMIDAPYTYDVDSMYLWDQLNKNDGNYQEAWKLIDGWWGLAWTDLENVWIQCHKQEVSICHYEGIVYFSSDYEHLYVCTGCTDLRVLDKEGQTIKLTQDNQWEELPNFKTDVAIKDHQFYDCNLLWKNKATRTTDSRLNTFTRGDGTNEIDDDDEWKRLTYYDREENVPFYGLYEDENDDYHIRTRGTRFCGLPSQVVGRTEIEKSNTQFISPLKLLQESEKYNDKNILTLSDEELDELYSEGGP